MTEQLNSTLLRQLFDALDKLLSLHRILCLDTSEFLRRKDREIRKLKLFRGLAYRVANTKDAGVKQTDNVPRVCRINNLSVLRKELLRLCKLDNLGASLMPNIHISLELTRTDTDKRKTIAMRRIHVCLNLKDKGREFIIVRLNKSHR